MLQVIAFTFEEKEFVEMAFRIRSHVFVIEQGVNREHENDNYELTAHHYLAFAHQEPVGAARWRETKEGIKLERFAVLKDFRNKGIGSLLLKKVIRDVKSRHKIVYLHAQLSAVNFYLRAGFIIAGDVFTEANIQHFRMEWTE